MSKYKLVNPPNVGSMIVLKPEGKGSVPLELRGMYTSKAEALKAVNAYEEQMDITRKEIEVAREALKLIKADKRKADMKLAKDKKAKAKKAKEE